MSKNFSRITISLLLITTICSFCLYPTEAQLPFKASHPIEAYEDGITLYEQGAYAYAREHFIQFIGLHDDFDGKPLPHLVKQAQLHIALCALWLEEEQAELQLRQYIDFNRPDPLVYIAAQEIANLKYKEKKYQEAIDYYELIDTENLDEEQLAEVSFKRGYSYFVKKSFQDAKADFNRSSQLRTKYYYPANYYLGMCYFFENDYERASLQFNKVEASKKYKDHVPYYITQIKFEKQAYQEVISYGESKIDMPNIKNRDKIEALIGRAYFETGNYERALPYLQKLENNNIDLTESDYYQLGLLYYKNGDYIQAISKLRKIAPLKSDLGQNANYFLAHSLLKTGKKEDARNAFSNVKRQSYNTALAEEALFNYGLLSAELRYDREAVNALIQIDASSSYYAKAQDALSGVFLNTSDYDRAIQLIEQLGINTHNLKSAYQKVCYYKAQQLYNEQKYNESESYLSKSADFAIDNKIQALGYYLLGEIHHLRGDYDSSIRFMNTYSTTVKNAGKLPDEGSAYLAHYTQGYNYLKLKDYHNAQRFFEKCTRSIKLNEVNIENDYISNEMLSDAIIRLADCHFKRNQYDEALKNYLDAFKMHKKGFVYAYYQSGIIYGLKGDAVQKIVILEDLVEKYPNASMADDALLENSNTYLSLGQYDEAAEPAIKLTKEYPQSSLITKAYLQLGLISFNKGDNSNALKYYKGLFKYNPTASERQDALQALQEIYVGDLNKPDDYIEFVESVSGGKITDTAKDSLNYKAAYIKYTSAEYEEAKRAFTNYIEKYPGGIYDIPAHFFRAECFGLDMDFSNAFRDYEYIGKQGPGKYQESSVHKAALIAYNDLRNFTKSLELYQKLNQLTDEASIKLEAQLGAMRSAYRLQQRDDVVRYAMQVIESLESSEEQKLAAHYYLSKTYKENGELDKALLSLNILSKNIKDERAAEARYLIADIYYIKKELNISEQMCRLAIRENGNYPYWVAKSLILLADVLVAKDDLFNAKAALEAVLENFKEDDQIRTEASEKLKTIETLEKEKNKLIKKEKSDLLELEEN